ncbi:MAG: hypothetical protein WD357_05595 [Gracilimonas sp.]
MKLSTIYFYLFVLGSLINTEVSAQQADTSVSFNKHQLGFNAFETIRLFEKNSAENYKLYYRYKFNSSTALRTGFNYRMNTSGKGQLNINLRVGVDKIFKESGKWKFYTGGDLLAGYEKFSSSDRKNYMVGAGSFLGIIHYINEHFSLSTEPGFLFKVKYYKNPNTFNPIDSETWVEVDLVNVGQVILSVHF